MTIVNTYHKALLLMACTALPLPLVAAISPGGGVAASSDYTAKPPAVIESTDPLIIIDLSVELTQQAEAYTDGNLNYGPNICPDRTTVAGRTSGICYFDNYDYIGYFDSKKCYLYDTNGANTGVQTAESPYTGPSGGVYRGSTPNPATKPDRHFFKPSSLAKADHTCAGANEWSGNYLNWATMSAIDEFRAAMTGGARLLDTVGANAETLLVNNYDKSWRFVPKAIGRGGSAITKSGYTFNNDSKDLTPFNTNTLVAINHNGALEHKVQFYDGGGALLGEYNVIVKVCDPAVGLEDNCVEYTDGTNTWYKPEGLLQKNAVKMRYALSSYIAQNGNTRNGGVMRALAKYIGYVKPADGGGLEVNNAGELAADGRLVYNPDAQTYIAGKVTNSGLINYINNFGLGPNGYKANDPVAELYYESLKYFKGLAPTAEYSSGMNDAMYDNFPVYNKKSDWDASEPLSNVCQTTYKLYVGDQFAWADHNLPGSSCVTHIPASSGAEPSGPDTDIQACTQTNTVGTMENYSPGTLGSRTRGRSNNGWFIAGLAHYARTNDLRSEDGIQTIKTFMVDTAEYSGSPPQKQANPLWLAAKFGGFEDTNNDKNPNTPIGDLEWDADGDGVPDTYTVANQPDNLVNGLNAAFAEFSKGSASSSAAAVVSNSAGGTGAIYQALYEPRVTGDGAGEIVDWTGTVISFFIDDLSRFREDCLWDVTANAGAGACVGSGNKILEDTDPEIKFRAAIDPTTSEKVVVYDRYSVSAGTLIASDHSFKEMGVIFDAAKNLASLDDSKIPTQRAYNDVATDGRYILTSLNGTDTVPFDSTTFTALDTNDSTDDPRRLLAIEGATEFDPVTSADLGEALVNFIRGQDQNIPGWRSRKITTKVGTTTEVTTKRMGDIINSAPVVVGRPSDIFSVRYADPEYAFYVRRYADRRQVAYVGANDGMLHAFNAGFYGTDSATAKPTFATSPADLSSGTGSAKTAVRHPLGSELWSYVPYNLLPHLQWLKELEYPHVYYMDGNVQSFDVNIFDDCSSNAIDTCTHPYGWGTILVATMRFGGGDISIDPNSDSDGDPSDDLTMRSAIVVFDVTDPEQPPVLLAEITHPELGYTTSKPVVYKERVANSNGDIGGSVDNWYLSFGSGPAGTDAASKTAALKNAVSNQNARLFVYDLKNNSFVSGYAPKILTETNSFVGDLSVMDWNNDYVDDAIYFGTVGGSVSSPTGQLMRFAPGGKLAPSLMLSGSNQPYTAAPKPLLDRRGEAWVFAGTGRFFVADDILSSQQQSYHGVKENTLSYPTIDKADLVDTTDIVIFADGSATAPDTVSDAKVASPSTLVNETATTYSQVRSIVSNSPHGWFIDLGNTAARNLLSATLIREILLFDEYTPSGDTCSPAGSSRLFNLNMLSGTPSSDITFATDPGITNAAGSIKVLGGIDMGDGQIIGISAHRDTAIVGMGGGSGSGGFRMTNTTATISKIPFGRRSWREIPINN